MDTRHDGVDTVIVVGADQASFYEFVKPRQEARGHTLVLLDRRRADRRRDAAEVPADRRRRERRREAPEAALALMSVLGFMVLHRDGGDWGA